MKDRERAKALIEKIPESKLIYIIPFLEGAAIPDSFPRHETLEAINEMKSGGGAVFDGSTHDFLSAMLED